jgi:hypothetical protein
MNKLKAAAYIFLEIFDASMNHSTAKKEST